MSQHRLMRSAHRMPALAGGGSSLGSGLGAISEAHASDFSNDDGVVKRRDMKRLRAGAMDGGAGDDVPVAGAALPSWRHLRDPALYPAR